jgi:hypothetical protein
VNGAGGTGVAPPGDFAGTVDGELDPEGVRIRDLPRRAHHGPEGAGAQVYLRLGEVERVCTFDGTRRHVVADRVADYFAEGVDDDGHFRLGHVDGRVGPDGDGTAVTDDPPRRRLEEQLRPLGVVNELVDARRPLALLDARLTRDHVGDAGGPDLGPPPHLLPFSRETEDRGGH